MTYEYTGMGDAATAEGMVALSHISFDAGRYTESLMYLQQAAGQDPSNPVRYQMAQIFPMVRLGQCVRAENIFNQYRGQASSDPNIDAYQSAVQGCLRPMPDFDTVPIVDLPPAMQETPSTINTVKETAQAVVGNAVTTAIQTARDVATDVAGGGASAVQSLASRVFPYVAAGAAAVTFFGVFMWFVLRSLKKPSEIKTTRSTR